MKGIFGIIFATLIGAAASVTFCNLDKQFLTIQMECESCSDQSQSIGVNGTRCCHTINGTVSVLDSSDSPCCTNIQPPVFGLTTCQITADCYQRFYGQDLSDLSLYLNGIQENFTACNALVISTTPAYQTTTSCADCNASCTGCNATTPLLPSSSASKIPSLLFITICQLVWKGFAS